MSTRRPPDETRAGVGLTSLDQPLSDDTGVTKRQLLDYLDTTADRLLDELAGRPLSVVRVRPGQPAFMQKNLPISAPDWIPTLESWSYAGRRQVRYPVVEDRRALLWFGNQRAVEFHVPLHRGADPGAQPPDALVLDLDPPTGAHFAAVVAVAHAARQVLAEVGLEAAVKTSGSRGLHLVVPLRTDPSGALSADDAAAATRALAARTAALDPVHATTEYIVADRGGRVFVDATRSRGATVVAAYSPRVRPGLPVSCPVDWADLDSLPGVADLTITTVAARLASGDPGQERRPGPQTVPADVVAEGHGIPVARVAAMHEGRRRARARRVEAEGAPSD